LFSAHPSPEATAIPVEIERLRTISDACSRAIRRGWCAALMDAYYRDCERWYAAVDMEYITAGGIRRVRKRIDVRAIRAPPELGGHGILPPCQYVYDLSFACTVIKPDLDVIAKQLAVYPRRHRLPGIRDLCGFEVERFQRDVGIGVTPEVQSVFEKNLRLARSAQDGSGRINYLKKIITRARCLRRVHRVNLSGGRVPAALAGLWMRRFSDSLDDASLMHGHLQLRELMRGIAAPVGDCLLKHLWSGLAEHVVNALPAAAATRVIFDAAAAVAPGRALLLATNGAPLQLQERYIRDGLPPVACTGAVLPPIGITLVSWAVGHILMQPGFWNLMGSLQLLMIRHWLSNVTIEWLIRRHTIMWLH